MSDGRSASGGIGDAGLPVPPGGEGPVPGRQPPATPPAESEDRRPAVFYPADGYPASYTYEDEVGLGEILQILRRRKWWAVAGFLLAFSTAVVWTRWQVPEWRSTTLVRVEDGENSGGGALSATRMAVPLFSAGSQIQTEMRVVTTRPMVEPVVERLDLHLRLVEPTSFPRGFLFSFRDFGRRTPDATYALTRVEGDRYRLVSTEPDRLTVEREFAAGDTVEIPGGRFVVAPVEQMRDLGVLTPPRDFIIVTSNFDAAVRTLAGALATTRPDPGANLFQISYIATDRYLVRDVVNAVADAYLERRQEVQKKKASSTVAFLRDQIDRVESELEAAEAELRNFREAEQVVAPEAMAESQVQQLASLRARRSELATEWDALQNLLNSIRDPGTGPAQYRRVAAFPTFLRNAAVQNILSALTEAEQSRTAMLERRTRDHPDVVALTEQIGYLESRVGEIARNYLSSLNDQIASLDAELARYGSELEEVPGEQLQLARLERRTRLLTDLHTMLQKRLKEAEIAEAVEDLSVRVVEAAVLPSAPVSPKPMRNLLFGGFLGLMLGVGLAFVREYTDRSIHTDEDVEEALGLAVLSRVPRLPEAEKRDERKRGEALVAQQASRSLPAESYRTLRTNVRYARAGKGVKEIAVTSPGARDGKSTTAGNLAVTFAQQGNRTLLIDADLRKSVQHLAFKLDRSPGLADYLVGDADLREVVRVTNVEELYLIPAGSRPPNPAELLDGRKMERLMELVRERFDAVVLDTPPALVVADASVVGRRVEGVLLVVRADKTDRHAAEDALEQLERVDANVVGVVLNAAKSDGKYGYYKYRYYRDYYGDDGGAGGSAAGAAAAAVKDGWKRMITKE